MKFKNLVSTRGSILLLGKSKIQKIKNKFSQVLLEHIFINIATLSF